jgi:hypothetical protein
VRFSSQPLPGEAAAAALAADDQQQQQQEQQEGPQQGQQQQPAPGVTAEEPEEAALVRAAWRRLWEVPLDNRVKTLAYRLMHGALPCGAYRGAHGGGGSVFGCPFAPCAQEPVPPLATLTHLFVACPAYASARAWLADMWEALGGQRPPLTAEVLLGDRLDAWPDAPAAAQLRLWEILRLAWLFAVWDVSNRPARADRSSRAVVAAVVGRLRAAMQAQWCLCLQEERLYAVLPGSALQQRVPELEVSEFVSVWSAGGLLCVLDVGPAPGAAPVLRVRLSMQHPVAAPAAAGGGGGAAAAPAAGAGEGLEGAGGEE